MPLSGSKSKFMTDVQEKRAISGNVLEKINPTFRDFIRITKPSAGFPKAPRFKKQINFDRATEIPKKVIEVSPVSKINAISEANQNILESMSPEEIECALQEIHSIITQENISFLKSLGNSEQMKNAEVFISETSNRVAVEVQSVAEHIPKPIAVITDTVATNSATDENCFQRLSEYFKEADAVLLEKQLSGPQNFWMAELKNTPQVESYKASTNRLASYISTSDFFASKERYDLKGAKFVDEPIIYDVVTNVLRDIGIVPKVSNESSAYIIQEIVQDCFSNLFQIGFALVELPNGFMERRELHHHELEQEKAGYTLNEIFEVRYKF